jgi:outer membrane protein assembly factor BamD
LRRTLLVFAAGTLLLGATRSDAQILHKKKKVNKATTADNSAEPDKVLYDRAMDDIKHGKQEIGRLNLQTLINTYPDSEYLAKAKLGIADSYFKEGGTSNMTQAIQGYKDFIIFFPFIMPEASYAQHQVAMAHYRQMDKPDRDRTQARQAEEEFQTFLQKYPTDPLAKSAEQHLREVQEVLAEGDYRIGYYYYVKGDKRAAAGRLIVLTNRYPLYSKSDHALWMLGDIFEKSEKKDISANYFARIVRDYPLSDLVPDAKSRLTGMKAPIPPADPKAVAWMTAEQNAPRPKTSLIKKPMAFIKGGPGGEIQTASRLGVPTMTPEADETSDTEILRGATGTKVGLKPGTSIVTTATPGGTASGTAENAPASGDSSAAPADSATPAETSPNGATTAPTSESTTGTAPAAAASTDAAPATATSTDGAAKTDAAAGTTPAADTTKTDSSNTSTDSKDTKESSSKKKKGLKKLIPW